MLESAMVVLLEAPEWPHALNREESHWRNVQIAASQASS